MNKAQLRSERGLGDTAVDGLLAGIVAGIGMVLYLLMAGLMTGQGTAEVLGSFDPLQANHAFVGLLTHLAVAAIYGLLFGLLLGLGKLHAAIGNYVLWLGLVYGLLLFGLARGVLLTAVDSPLLQVTAVHFGVAHLIYGLVLGYWLGKK